MCWYGISSKRDLWDYLGCNAGLDMYSSKDNVSLYFNLILEMPFGELTCNKVFVFV